MGIILSIQLSAFSNRKITPSVENTAVIMSDLKELSGIRFLPHIINTHNINILAETVETIPNLSFSSINESRQIICTDDRIDCIFHFDTNGQENIKSSLNTASRLLSSIMQHNDISASRLALNVYFFPAVGRDKHLCRTNIMCVIPFYRERVIKEWFSRMNAMDQVRINNADESINIITEYTHTTEPASGESRILCHADINTAAENKDFRFKYDSIDIFKAQAWDIYQNIQSDIERLVNSEK